MAVSLVRQNFHRECEGLINKQINLELHASYVYLAMAYHFDREDVALPGFFKFLKAQSDEEREHAEKLMKYQNQRGGRIFYHNIQKCIDDEWASPVAALESALQLEKTVNQSLLDMHSTADQHGDVDLCNFLESHYLTEQVESMKKLSEYITNVKRAGPGIGEFIFDKESFGQ